MSECRSEKKVLGLGDIAALLRKLDELRKQGAFSDVEYRNIKEALLA